MMITLLAVVVMSAQAQVTGDRSIASKCEVSTDATYGHTRANPIKVGGEPMFGPARQRRFLQALAGPAGQAIAFKRRGSLAPDADSIILDLYDVTYSGLEKPIELYLDLYRWEPPKAPQGFVCAREIGLRSPEEDRPVTTASTSSMASVGVPRPPGMVTANMEEINDRLLDVVLASRDVPPPIPLQPGSAERGMIFDFPRRIAIVARDLAARGETPSKKNMPRLPPSFLIVANAAPCGAPASITVEAGPSGRIGAIGAPLKGDALKQALPGVALKEGALGVMFGGYIPRGAVVYLTYEGSSCSALRLTLATTGIGRRLVDAPATPPPGLSATPPGYIGNMTLKVSFAIGPDGAPSGVTIVSGDARYAEAAIEAVKRWRFELPLINGAPVYSPSTMMMDIVFRDGGGA